MSRNALWQIRRTLTTGQAGAKKLSAKKRYMPDRSKLNSQKGVLQFLDIGSSAGAKRNGRAWRPSELRLKSFEDLHKLWFILLKERNTLLTEKAWCKTNDRHWVNGESNLYKVKQSMGRIKVVLGERERALKVKMGLKALQEEADGAALGDGIVESTTPSQ